VVFQGILGMLTVTWQLKPLVVTLHLLFGLTTLGLLWWTWLSLSRNVWSRVRAADGGEVRPGRGLDGWRDVLVGVPTRPDQPPAHVALGSLRHAQSNVYG